MKGLDVGIVPALFPYPWGYLHGTHYRKSSIKPPGELIFFQALLRGGLIERGGLKSEGGGLFNTNTRCAIKDHFASAGPRSS